MSKHTPGPWVHLGCGDIVQKAEDYSGVIKDIAAVYLTLGDEDEANARLIAAAPDLLDACKKALYALKGREHDKFLRDAIAKATGEQA